ncbi:MAG: hypothetical protein WDW38_005225 [Sanguina aurantia]
MSGSVDAEMDAACVLSFTTPDNHSSPTSSIITIEAQDYPGLLQSVCWVMNGLGAKVVNAQIETLEDGTARDKFWITDRMNKKLPDGTVAAMCDRIQDFIAMCGPTRSGRTQQVWESGVTTASNIAHDRYTVLMIEEPFKGRAGFLLEIVTVMTGTGATVHEALIQGSADGPGHLAPANYDFATHGRMFRFHLTQKDGSKLDGTQIAALLFTLAIIIGTGHIPTAPPTSATYSVKAYQNAV